MTKKHNILIVDDNAKNIQLAANVLKSTDLYNIFFSTSGEKAIEQLKLRRYSLILLDINMPGLNGYETASIIKNDSNTANIPIIFLSANANKDSIRKGFEHGAEDYITKPFDELELIHRVKTHVELFNAKEQLLQEVNETRTLLEQYKIAVDAAASVSKADLSGDITYVNDKFCALTKYPREELIGKNHRIFRSPDVSNEIYKEMWETITNKKTWNGLVKNIAKDGSNYYFESTIIPIVNYNNEIVEYISIRTDITKEMELQNDIVATQEEVLQTLGELGEWRSKETGDHVNRVSLFSELLARAHGCDEENVALLKMASPMHDIGKVIIPDAILLKPGKLSDEEFELMKNHTTFGWEIFNKSKHQLLQAAALISYQHHEKWNGTGYPRGISGEDIHVFGRITAIADVFDALCHDRIYKKAWSVEDTLDFIKSQSGIAFEPELVDLLIENIDEILKIKQKYNK
ncbi:response regulator receiver modulated metal dependent phosphohydrolase [Sulfurimonas gotlandica GD1]|uniref:Response regulator receiver modulated metal dependent phosphohydrolase n=1 Tax=Sulfurimonas gotlandica (strain DSM 19862 / JCM 16533 / GD1) TaxID=929558 RepID=B6BMH8_SULGG|nr:HD domain-containing phosphohydrolase [Sulfurimonas gotlandica]EDZ61891.1 response regulator receiver modulated metal dependent phosphohydrolase [Sulfurimonas gotlandica GD1]EHP29243.1 response regulator receiver modulated metal dependent phosphohydrolase [Sulfurimonas gotlandica GD1]